VTPPPRGPDRQPGAATEPFTGRSFVTPPPHGSAAADRLLERDAELTRIRAALRAAHDGAGAALLIEGEAGIGKTTLLRSATGLARGHGFRVLTARGGELEQEFAYGVARQLFERELADRDADDRARLLEGAAGFAAAALRPAASGHGDAPAGARPRAGRRRQTVEHLAHAIAQRVVVRTVLRDERHRLQCQAPPSTVLAGRASANVRKLLRGDARQPRGRGRPIGAIPVAPRRTSRR
ncbi:MAG: ATP-binding protein, partial [Solirubrobacteraceae bacterium]